MNPWQPKRLALRTTDLGGLEEFCEVAYVKDEGVESELIGLQQDLFRTMDMCRKYNSTAKARNDFLKYGEFISTYELEYKAKLLNRLKVHLSEIIASKDKLIGALASESRANSLTVDCEKQTQFIQFMHLASQGSSFYSLLSESTKVHDLTLRNVSIASKELLTIGDDCQDANDLYRSLAKQVKEAKTSLMLANP